MVDSQNSQPAAARSDSCDTEPSGRPLLEWLVESALPMWSSVGVDLSNGGFYEKIDLDGRPVCEPRRARVAARQVYVFATAARRGWLSKADELVEHGLRFLFDKMRLPDGSFAAAVDPDGRVVDGRFDLYEHAFILFAMATAMSAPGRSGHDDLRNEAEALLRCMRGRWSHPVAGFEESSPPSVPLKSNPHMHLLEAALAWVDISTGAQRVVWDDLADELAELCLARFIDPATGALHEYFTSDWGRVSEGEKAVVEPGHQFEWAWLLTRWGLRRARQDALAAARCLLVIGETCGVDAARGVAVNTLDVALKCVDGNAKLWPQTERIKAWHLAATSSTDDRQIARASRCTAQAVNGLRPYLLTEPAGLWREQMRPDGSFEIEHCRASSLYHLVGAIDALCG